MIELDIITKKFLIEQLKEGKYLSSFDEMFFLKEYKIQKSSYDNNNIIFYKFYTSIEEFENNYFSLSNELKNEYNNSNIIIIPVLIILNSDIYSDGYIYYNNEIRNIRNLVEELNEKYEIFPFIFINVKQESFKNQFLGEGILKIYIDFIKIKDINGFFSKDVLNILNFKFYKNKPGNFTFLKIKNLITLNLSKIFFIPLNINFLSSPDALISRIENVYKIRYSNIIKGNCEEKNISVNDNISYYENFQNFEIEFG